MKILKSTSIFVMVLMLFSVMPVNAQEKGMNSITAGELRVHLNFIAADEFEGRDTPSPGLEICSRYLATMAESYGFKPLMPDGSFYQNIPLELTSVSETKTRLRVITGMGEQVFYFPQAFGGRFSSPGTFGGDVVFVGYGINAPEQGWDDYGDVDLTGRVVIMLEGQLPDDHALRRSENRRILSSRSSVPRTKGAAAVLTVISKERENEMASGGIVFSDTRRVRMVDSYESQSTARRSRQTTPPAPQQPAQQPPPQPQQPQRPPLPFVQAEIRHDVAAAILDVSKNELSDMFAMISRGVQVPRQEMSNKRVELSVGIDTNPGATQSVVAVLEGSDQELKNEYVVIGAHHDHLGVRNGEIYNGADDNGSATVALLEIAQAMVIEKPKRSVILVWHTGEEKGLYGSHYFVNNCPVPVEKISTCLNLDMLCRNDPDSLYLIASDNLSTELDGAINGENDKYIKLNFDYVYNDRAHPQRFYYRSDHYPYIRFGIPSVWFFCGTTPDYHQPTDTIDRVDFKKMERVTRLVYLTAYEGGNKNELLKLDANPEVTTRGKHNLSVESIK